jgi:hypothetical protein
MKVSGRAAMTFLLRLSVAVVIAFASSKSANATTTIDPVNKYAWGANIGWTNWLPSDADGVAIGQTLALTSAFVGAFGLTTTPVLGQGPLTPPGPPAATMKTLDQIDAKLEKRTAISSLPFSITAPGSYYLAQNLGVSNSSAITISVDNVSLDLNGFTLSGSGSSQSGIIVSGSHWHIRVSNGSIRGFGANGLDLSNVVPGEISSIVASSNGGIGISVGDTVTVRDCAFRENNNDNFRGGAHLTFSHCTAVLSTTGHGFNVGSNCVFTDCVSNSNALYGYAATVHCLFKDCVASASNNRNYLNTVGDANVGPLQSPDNATSPWANF